MNQLEAIQESINEIHEEILYSEHLMKEAAKDYHRYKDRKEWLQNKLRHMNWAGIDTLPA